MNRIKSFIFDNKKEIIVGIVVFVLTSLISGFINAIRNSAPEVGSSILSLFRGIVYSSAAKQNTDSLVSILIIAGVGFGLGALGVFIAKAIRLTNEDIKLGKSLQTDIEQIRKGDKISPASVSGSAENTSSTKIVSEAKKLKKAIVAYIFLILFAFLFFMLTSFLPNTLWNVFRRNITMIAPYSDEKTIMTLQSDWVRMKTREDYLGIYQTINEIKGENSLP